MAHEQQVPVDLDVARRQQELRDLLGPDRGPTFADISYDFVTSVAEQPRTPPSYIQSALVDKLSFIDREQKLAEGPGEEPYHVAEYSHVLSLYSEVIGKQQKSTLIRTNRGEIVFIQPVDSMSDVDEPRNRRYRVHVVNSNSSEAATPVNTTAGQIENNIAVVGRRLVLGNVADTNSGQTSPVILRTDGAVSRMITFGFDDTSKAIRDEKDLRHTPDHVAEIKRVMQEADPAKVIDIKSELAEFGLDVDGGELSQEDTPRATRQRVGDTAGRVATAHLTEDPNDNRRRARGTRGSGSPASTEQNTGTTTNDNRQRPRGTRGTGSGSTNDESTAATTAVIRRPGTTEAEPDETPTTRIEPTEEPRELNEQERNAEKVWALLDTYEREYKPPMNVAEHATLNRLEARIDEALAALGASAKAEQVKKTLELRLLRDNHDFSIETARMANGVQQAERHRHFKRIRRFLGRDTSEDHVPTHLTVEARRTRAEKVAKAIGGLSAGEIIAYERQHRVYEFTRVSENDITEYKRTTTPPRQRHTTPTPPPADNATTIDLQQEIDRRRIQRERNGSGDTLEMSRVA